MRQFRWLAVAVTISAIAAAAPVTAGPLSPKQVWVSISGRITDGQSGAGVGGLCVHALEGQPGPDGSEEFVPVGLDTQTGPYGYYSITWQMSKDDSNVYQVQSDARCGANGYWQAEVYGKEVSVAARSGANHVTGINMVTRRAGRIIGRLTDSVSGAPISGAGLSIRTPDVPDTSSASDGTFVLDGIAPSVHTLFITAPSNRWLSEFYHHQPTSSSSPQKVVVTAGTDTVIDETLLRSDTITGTITVRGTGLPVAEAHVTIHPLAPGWPTDLSEGSLSVSNSSSTDTDQNGQFVFTGLGPGPYALCVYPQVRGLFAGQCWKDKPYSHADDPGGWRNATPLSLTGFGTTVNIHQSVPLR
jgi:hypothetical protein